MGFIRTQYRNVFFLLSLFMASAAFAAAPQERSLLRVAVVMGDPFATKTASGYQGISVDLWEAIAADNHWDFRYIPTGNNVDQTLKELQAGKFDLVIGPLSVNELRLLRVNFSRPYFINAINVIMQRPHFQLASIIKPFLTPVMAVLFAALIASFILYLHIFWYFERGINPEIPLSYREVINKGLWTHLFKQCFSGMPMTGGGKFTLLFWLLCMAALFSTFNATLTSSFTLINVKEFDSIDSLQDLSRLDLLGVMGASGTTMARNRGLTLQTVNSLEAAVAIINENPLAGLVSDNILAQQYLKDTHQKKLMISNYALGQEEYAFALPYNSSYTKELNLTLVKLQDNQAMTMLCLKNLGDQAQYCQL